MKRVCARQQSQRYKAKLSGRSKGFDRSKGEPMTSRKQPPGRTGGGDLLPMPRKTVAGAVFGAAAAPLRLPFHGSVGATTEEATRNAACFNEALTLLARSETGRYLMTELAQLGYGAVFDSARTEAQGASALCDSYAKRVLLRSTDDGETLALLLAHEAVHALQNARADDLLPSARHKPGAIFKLALAIEADAYAQQLQVAYELAYGERPCARPLLQMRRRFPGLTRAGDRILVPMAAADARAALADGRVVAALFNAFYDDFSLRSYYEASHLNWINDFAARRAPKPDAAAGGVTARFNQRAGLADMFRRDMATSRLRGLLQWRGRAYLAQHRPDIDFNAPRHAGVSVKTKEGIAEFYRTWLPGRRAEEIATFGLYVAPAAPAPEDKSGARMAAHKNKPPGRPIKAPRKRKRDFW
jgi:hypothetical protein